MPFDEIHPHASAAVSRLDSADRVRGGRGALARTLAPRFFGWLSAAIALAAVGCGGDEPADETQQTEDLCAGVVCEAKGACEASTCDPSTGTCKTVELSDGTPCDDGDLCTSGDLCTAGACAGVPVKCEAPDACHGDGTCDPTNGLCTYPVAADGTACDDGDACTQKDTCEKGVCTGSNPVKCGAAPDDCHENGVCDPFTGACYNPAKPDGASCDDGDKCTTKDACVAGACSGTPVVCEAKGSCHEAGTCDPDTGECTEVVKPDGTSCDDGDACTKTDTCVAGACVGADPVVCGGPGGCTEEGVCDPATGTCSGAPKPDGTACDDGNACTQTDACTAGVCSGADPVVCAAVDDCHDAGECDPATGTCSSPEKPDGTMCDDGDGNTKDDQCQAGVCEGVNACGPESVTFSVLATDCGGGPADLVIDGVVVGTLSATAGCGCPTEPVVVKLTNPEALELVDGCKDVYAFEPQNGGVKLSLGWVKVEVAYAAAPAASVCLFDAIDGGDCAPRSLCVEGGSVDGAGDKSKEAPCADCDDAMQNAAGGANVSLPEPAMSSAAAPARVPARTR